MSSAPKVESLPVVTAWLKELDRRVQSLELGTDTAANYRNHFIKLCTWLLAECDGSDEEFEQSLSDSDAEQVKKYLLLISEKYKPNALRTHLCSLRQAFAWLQDEYSTIGPELIRKPERLSLTSEDTESKVKVDDSQAEKQKQEAFVAVVDIWMKGIGLAQSEQAEARELLIQYICFVDSSTKCEWLPADEVDAYHFILGLGKKGPLSRYIENENELPEWVINSRVGYILLDAKVVLPSFVRHTVQLGTRFELTHSVLLKFYQWACDKKVTPFGETLVSDILTETWTELLE